MKKIALVTFALFLSSVMGYNSAVSYAAVPHAINYQGRLTDKDNRPVSDNNYAITFRIFDAESAGTLLWEETQTVLVQKGIFSVILGGVTNLDLAFDKPYWLEIKVGVEVMSPRQRISSSGYAYRSEVADTVKEGSISLASLSSAVTTNLVPQRTIVLWSGSISAIPQGWALCDGTNGTPDLRKRFVIGADTDNPSTSLLVGSHSAARITGKDNSLVIDSGSNAKSDGGGTCTAQHVNMIPDYYALAYIMKL